jgi:hypothetical protein
MNFTLVRAEYDQDTERAPTLSFERETMTAAT